MKPFQKKLISLITALLLLPSFAPSVHADMPLNPSLDDISKEIDRIEAISKGLKDQEAVKPDASGKTPDTSDKTPAPKEEAMPTVMEFTLNKKTYTVNGTATNMDAAPVSRNERTLLPVIYVAGPLGAEINWEPSTKKVTISLNETLLELWIGKGTAKINGADTPIDSSNSKVKPITLNGRTMLPLRFVAESLGCDVNWNGATQGITVTSIPKGTAGGKSESTPEGTPGDKFGKFGKHGKFGGLNNDLLHRYATDSSKTEPENKLPTWITEHKKGDNAISDSFYKMPVVKNLGKGYDTINGVYGEANPKLAVLDLDLLQKYHFIEKQWKGTFLEDVNIAESLDEYTKNMQVDVKAKGNYLFFGGSVDVNYGKQTSESTNHYFATFSYMNARNDIYIPSLWTSKEGYGRYKAFLLPEAKNAINDKNYPVSKLVDNYGSFVLTGLINGGRADYNIKTDQQAVKGKEDFGLKVNASADFIIAGASVDTAFKTETEKNKFRSNTEQKIRITGFKHTLSPEAFRKNEADRRNWEQGLTDENSNMISFSKVVGVEPIIPIWELCDDPARKEAIKGEVSDRVNSARGKLPRNVPIKRKYVSYIYVGMNSDELKARQEAEGGGATPREVLYPEANHHAGGDFCYLGVTRLDSPNFAIRDLLVFSTEDKHYKPPYNKDFYRNGITQNYNLVVKQGMDVYNPKAKNYYHKNHHTFHLNHNAGGDYLYLYQSFERNKAPIYDIMILDTSEHQKGSDQSDADFAKEWAEKNDWEPVTFDVAQDTPANLNHNAGGHKLFLMVRRDYSVK